MLIRTAAISIAASGNNTIVAGETGKKHRIIGLMLVANDSVNVYVADSDGTNIVGDASNPINLLPSSGFVLPMVPKERFWSQSPNGAGLIINLSSAVSVAGVIVYETY